MMSSIYYLPLLSVHLEHNLSDIMNDVYEPGYYETATYCKCHEQLTVKMSSLSWENYVHRKCFIELSITRHIKHTYLQGKTDKDTFLYSAVSSHWDCSKRFTLHSLADAIALLWEGFSHAEIIARRPFVHISTTVCCQVLVYS